MKEEYPTYEISNQTLKDIIDNIPEEKWDAVMVDLGAMLKQVSGTMKVIKTAAEVLGLDPSEVVQLGETMTWVDDGKCENFISLTDINDGSEVGKMTFKESGLEVK
ncbi:hypothetical protein NVP1149O_24 [Vibrio phage 1.149.O._10N.286.55.A12]|nr:hypothetical protein NVP1149O_24 [Vibrio phage 1.149.O._10N.286.55.A12]